MCNLSDGVEEKGIQRGLQKGISTSVKILMDTINWTVKESMDTQKIKEEEHSMYMKLLQNTDRN